jgi:hypothetical protein
VDAVDDLDDVGRPQVVLGHELRRRDRLGRQVLEADAGGAAD